MLEAPGLLPDGEGHLADDILGFAGIAGQPQHEAVDPRAVAAVERAHGRPVAGRDAHQKLFIRLSRRMTNDVVLCRKIACLHF